MLTVRKGRYSGKMSGGARKRLTKAITLMAMAIKPRTVFNPVLDRYVHHHLSFITLTVSGRKNISARKAMSSLFEPFLQWMRRDCGHKYGNIYLWKVELQTRGQIHYHIVTPAFIPMKELQEKWNYLQRKAGYLKDYVQEKRHYKAPSTHIKAVCKKRNTTGYLVKCIIKEMGKAVDARELQIRQEVREEIEAGKFDVSGDPAYLEDWECRRRIYEDNRINGKAWDCCNELAGAKYFTIPFTPHHLAQYDLIDGKNGLRLKSDDYWHLIIFTSSSPPDLLTTGEKIAMINYFESIFNGERDI